MEALVISVQTIYCMLQKRLSTGTEVLLDLEDAAGLWFTKPRVYIPC